MTTPFADYVTNLAAGLTVHVLANIPGWVQAKWEGDEAEAAVRRCINAGVVAFMSRARHDDPAYAELHELIFPRFFRGEVVGVQVGDQIAGLLEGRRLKREALQYMAGQAGYDPEQFPDLDFMAAMAEFEGAFLTQAVREPALQGVIDAGNMLQQTKLDRMKLARLDRLVELLESITSAGGDITRIEGSEIETLVQGDYFHYSLAPGTPDTSAALTTYLEWLTEDRRSLPLRGIAPSGQEQPPELAQVYVALNTTTRKEEPDGGGRPDENTEPLSALAAAATNRRMVLLGDPGSGKSTFVSHLAYCLAAHRLYPEDNWLGQLPDWPTAETTPLPLLVILRDFARWLPEPLPARATAVHLSDFVEETLQDHKLDGAWPALEAALDDGDAIVLLDGLDEVTTTAQRRFVRDAIVAFVKRYGKCRVLVTCRVFSYQYDPEKAVEDLRLPPAHYPQFTLDEFNPEQRRDFVGAWYKELKRQGHLVGYDASRLGRDLQRAIAREDLAEMAGNPLLLTMMAVVHKDRGELPDSRVVLYDEVVDLLLKKWDEVKVEDDASPLRDLLDRAKRKDIDLKRALSAVAYQVHTEGGAPEEEGTADISEAFLWRELGQLKKKEVNGNYEPDVGWAQELVGVIKRRAGLLVERSTNGPLAFPHRTIQEYLAGAHLASLEGRDPTSAGAAECADFVDCALHWARQDVGWWPMILFAVEHRVYVGQRQPYDTLELVNKLCPPGGEASTIDWRLVWLAGDVLLSLGRERAIDKALGQQLLPRVRHRLAALLDEGRLTPRERAEAGMILGQLGDPRPGVGVDPETGLPDVVWSEEISAGKYTIGGRYGFDVGEISIERPYRLARYPITNAQFQCFLEADDRDDPQWWEGIPEDERKFSDPEWPYANHPRERVSWYQALAFCRWLTDKLHKGELPAGALEGDSKEYVITLPHEYEWEVGARWPNENVEKRIYPWGPEFDVAKANTYEGERVGQTTAVGMYPSGKNAALDLYDLSGNVWEWCRNPYDEPDKDIDPEDVYTSNAWRVVRGGSWNNYRDSARSAYRFYDSPDLRDGEFGFRVVCVACRPPISSS